MFLLRMLARVDGPSKGSDGFVTVFLRCVRRSIRAFYGERAFYGLLRRELIRSFWRYCAAHGTFHRICFSPRNAFYGDFGLVACANASDRFVGGFYFGRYEVRVRAG